MISYVVVVLVGGVVFGLYWFGINKVFAPLPKGEDASQAKKYTPSPTLLVRYSMGTLPIDIHPQKTAYVLQLNPNITNYIWEVPNNGRKTIKWPLDFKVNKTSPPEAICVGEITNYGDKTLLDVSMSIKVSFHELDMVSVTTSIDAKGKHVTMPTPGTDHIVVTFPDPTGRSKPLLGARDGAVVKQFTHTISIPVIAPHMPVNLYFVSQSKYISKFSLPIEATAVLADTSERVPVKLVRPQANVEDAFPWFGLAPAIYHWHGVPDAP